MTEQEIKEISIWIPVISAFVGGVIAVSGNTILSAISENRKNRNIARNLAGAISGEVSNICHLFRVRDFLKETRGVISEMEEDGLHRTIRAKISYNYFKVYEANLSQFGILQNDLPIKISRFYGMCSAILEDLNASYNGDYDKYDTEDMISIYKGLYGLIKDVLALGDDIFKIIETQYRQS